MICSAEEMAGEVVRSVGVLELESMWHRDEN
jgi:hypothetical protein